MEHPRPNLKKKKLESVTCPHKKHTQMSPLGKAGILKVLSWPAAHNKRTISADMHVKRKLCEATPQAYDCKQTSLKPLGSRLSNKFAHKLEVAGRPD